MDIDHDTTESVSPRENSPFRNTPPSMFDPVRLRGPLKRKRMNSDDEVSLFRRVRICDISDVQSAQILSISPRFPRVKVYECRNGDWFDRGTGFVSMISYSRVSQIYL
jgi:hypothetical protein